MRAKPGKLDTVGHAVWIVVGVTGIALCYGWLCPAVALLWSLAYFHRNHT